MCCVNATTDSLSPLSRHRSGHIMNANCKRAWERGKPLAALVGNLARHDCLKNKCIEPYLE